MCKNQKYFPLLGWKPNEVNANYYKKQNKHYLSAHFDDRRLSGELLANIEKSWTNIIFCRKVFLLGFKN